MRDFECKNCERYVGNCGYHFIDSYGHIVYDIPFEGANGECFRPSERYLNELKKQKIQSMTERYSVEELEQALKELKREVEK